VSGALCNVVAVRALSRWVMLSAQLVSSGSPGPDGRQSLQLRTGEGAVNELVAVLVAVAAAITFGASDVIAQRATPAFRFVCGLVGLFVGCLFGVVVERALG